MLGANPSSATLSLVIPVSADVLAPNYARTSLSAVLPPNGG